MSIFARAAVDKYLFIRKALTWTVEQIHYKDKEQRHCSEDNSPRKGEVVIISLNGGINGSGHSLSFARDIAGKHDSRAEFAHSSCKR